MIVTKSTRGQFWPTLLATKAPQFVYALVVNDHERGGLWAVYIGRTNDPQRRLVEHRANGRSETTRMVILRDCSDKPLSVYEWELRYIEHYRKLGQAQQNKEPKTKQYKHLDYLTTPLVKLKKWKDATFYLNSSIANGQRLSYYDVLAFLDHYKPI